MYSGDVLELYEGVQKHIDHALRKTYFWISGNNFFATAVYVKALKKEKAHFASA